MLYSKPRPGPLYAMPNFANLIHPDPRGTAIDPIAQAKTEAIAEILRNSFQQSGTKIKHDKSIESAARHIVQSNLLKIELTV